MSGKIILACDVRDEKALTEYLDLFDPQTPYLKVGMELFYKEGPGLIHTLKEKGFPVFLDLKLHDIPTTVYKAMKSLASLNVDIVNVHAAGGYEMMKAARTGLEEGSSSSVPKLIAVTQLTSTDQRMLSSELLIDKPIESVIASYAKTAASAGLDGVVCSPHEVPIIKQAAGGDFITVTPGIRLAESEPHDQKRAATPLEAKRLGSDYIVVGRAVSGARDPKQVYETLLKTWEEEHV